MTLTLALSCIAVLLALSVLAVATGRSPVTTRIVYGASLAASLLLLALAATICLAQAPVTVTLPLGLPWLGAHFRIDALGAFFLAVVNLGAAAPACSRSATAATTRRRSACCRSIRLFLAGMNLVVLADDAFTFLVSWEFMSLTSWALVIAHHRERGQSAAPATSISSWRASARWRCCSPSACWPGPTAATPSRRSAMRQPSPRSPRWC